MAILHATPGVGNRVLGQILKHRGSLDIFYEAAASEIGNFLPPAACSAFLKRRQELEPLAVGNELDQLGVEIVCYDDEQYPAWLAQIPNPPQLLYYRGRIELAQQCCLAVVGSRQATAYGLKIAYSFATELAQQGVVIVSGLARGIDSRAHQGALKAAGDTISVLGCGINVVYPRENAKLYEKICQSGLVITEFPWQTPPLANHFPQRNRIISGISRGVLVVEARLKSGALITVDFALEQGREVFAIPGPISSPNSAGTNYLIQQGAKLTTCIEDILEEYFEPTAKTPQVGVSQPALPMHTEAEEVIIRQMSFEKCHCDDLLRLTGLAPADLNLALLKLELEGIVQSLPGNYYLKIG